MEMLVNMSDAREKQNLLAHVRQLDGKWRIKMVRHRNRRTDRQNRFYFPCVVAPFAEFLQSQGQAVTDLDAHEILKAKFLRMSVVNQETGEIAEYVRSTTTLNTGEFNEYLDRCAAWLAEWFHFELPDPKDYHEKEEPCRTNL